MIDSYSFGEITVDGTGYRSDVILFPQRVVADWWRESGHRLVLKVMLPRWKDDQPGRLPEVPSVAGVWRKVPTAECQV